MIQSCLHVPQPGASPNASSHVTIHRVNIRKLINGSSINSQCIYCIAFGDKPYSVGKRRSLRCACHRQISYINILYHSNGLNINLLLLYTKSKSWKTTCYKNWIRGFVSESQTRKSLDETSRAKLSINDLLPSKLLIMMPRLLFLSEDLDVG